MTMASLESKAFNIFLKLIRKKSFLKKQFDFGKFDFFKCPGPPKEILETCSVEKHTVNKRHVFTLHPRKKPSGKHILFLHGGAYVQNFVRQHWTFLGMLIDELQCTITAPDYPLAPAHTYRDAFDMVIPVYKRLAEIVKPSELILMGDSAGGGFALALTQYLHKHHIPQPSQLFLLSPWLDVTLQNPAIKEIDPLDPFLGIEGLRRAGKSYAGDTDPEMYLLSPINGPMEELPKTYLFVGSRDILAADARKLKGLLEEKNIPIHYHEYRDMIHVWMFLNFPESKKARNEIIHLIKGN
jgi:epsilon-lactone hydrolase